MELLYVACALASAALHAGWNAAVKSRPNVTHAMTAQMVVSAMLMAPLLLWTGLPTAASVPWIFASALINTVTVTALLKAYTLAGFGLAYPVGRAISVLLVAPGAALFFGETLSVFGLVGVALISASLAVLAFSGRHGDGPPLRAWLWIGLAGVTTAAYVLVDAVGARASGSPIAYGCCAAITNAAIMLWRQRHADIDAASVRREAWAMLPVACAAITSYLLILWVYTKAPIAAGAALRDTSALFAIVIAVVWLREPISRTQITALILAAAAVPLLRLG
jgi:drug/metabolite transporter (DMT)-like permease